MPTCARRTCTRSSGPATRRWRSLRDLHARLHPPQLDAIGLDAALRAEVERHFAPGALSVSLPPLPRTRERTSPWWPFRIGQALLRQAATRADGGR